MNETMSAIMAVAQTYLDGLHEGDPDKIAAAFHPCAHLYSLDGDKVADMPRAEWLGRIADRPKPSQHGLAREDRILAVDIIGDEAACVKLNCCIPPRYFTDYLLMLKTGEGWRIVSKSYRVEMRLP
jgi:hypothetical protein